MVRPVSLAGMSASLLIVLGWAETPVELSTPGHGPLLPASALVVLAPDIVAATGVSESQIDVGWRDSGGRQRSVRSGCRILVLRGGDEGRRAGPTSPMRSAR